MPAKKISWQPGYSIEKRPAKRSRSHRARPVSHGTYTIDFVAEDPSRRGFEVGSAVLRRSNEHSTSVRLAAHSVSDNADVAVSANLVSNIGNNARTEEVVREASFEAESGLPTHEHVIAFAGPLSLSRGVQFNSLAQRYEPLIDRYNMDFCKIPLTSDMPVNPFRYNADLHRQPMFLNHAVMALAGHHVGSGETQSHRCTSLQLMRRDLDQSGLAKRVLLSALDAIIILFSLDETQSVIGHWNTHLIGAFGLLEACGGYHAVVESEMVQVKVAILVWWDAIISLIAREDSVFPPAYFDAILKGPAGENWSFFSLCGCPLELVQVTMELVQLSSEKARAHSSSSDMSRIGTIENSLRSWQHCAPDTFEHEEELHQDRDKMHCSEAWRCGLLLYVYRVFRWQPGDKVPMHIPAIARNLIDHVCACRDQALISRQALLPSFFAACETRDPSLRKRILQLCMLWDERTRYHLFKTTIPLLEEVWAEQESKGFENTWWGEVVDRRHATYAKGHDQLKTRLCFG